MKNSRRDSRIELLRIVACLMILAHHVIQHNGNRLYALIETNFSPNQLISTLFGSWGQLGVTIFVIISAWFLIDVEKPEKTKKSWGGGGIRLSKICNIFVQTWSICLLMTVAYILSESDWSISLIAKELLTPFYPSQYWFVSTYIVFFVTTPLLNKAIGSMTTSQLKVMFVVFSICVPVYNYFFVNVGSYLGYFYFIYVAVAYLKRMPNNFIERNCKWLSIAIFTGTVVLISIMSCIRPLMGLTFRLHDCDNFSTFILAMCIFYYSQNMKKFENDIINKIASCSLGVYLITENFVVSGVLSEKGSIWNRLFGIDIAYGGATINFLIRVVATIGIAYIASVVIEFFRSSIQHWLTERTWVKSAYQKMDIIFLHDL